MRYMQLGLSVVVLSVTGWSQAPAPIAAPPEGSPPAVFHYRFAAVAAGSTVPNRARSELPGQLAGGAEVRPVEAAGTAALALDGQTGFVQVQGAEGLHIGAAGFSVLATVRFADSGTVEGQPDTHDMVLFKPSEYLFGRTRGRLYFNLHDGRDWVAGVVGGQAQAGVWVHVAAIVERIDEPPQGRVGYYVRLYLNGDLVASREILNCTGAANDNPVNLGKGWGGPWFLHGDLAEVTVYDRALTSGEFNTALKQEALATVHFRRTADPDPGFAPGVAAATAAVATAPAARRLELGRLLAAAQQAVHHVEHQSAVLPFLASVGRLARDGAADPVAAFATAHPEFSFLGNDRLAMAFFAPRPGAVALCSLYDLAADRELLGEQQVLWRLHYDVPGDAELRVLENTAAGVASTLVIEPATQHATMEWTHAAGAEAPIAAVVRAEMHLRGPRLEVSLDVENRSPEAALRQVCFPVVRLRRLEQGADRLLVPRMSGVLHDAPVRTHFTYEGAYPSGAAHMQFFAYYDDRSGVYVACEDGQARSKDLRALGDGDDCELAYLWHVGCPGRGGNGFRSSGPAAIESFVGDWFDAAQIYKRFAKTAAWWPPSRRREDTPDWFRNLTVWFIGNANTARAADDLVAMRQYLDLPIGLHWYGWNTQPFDDDYPHFTPREGFVETVARLRGQEVYAMPYINARIWETRDRGDEDFQYTALALPAAVKDRRGQAVIEGYNQRSFSPMCPTTALWQKTMADLCAQVAGYGVAGIYLDQVSAGRPRLCFDPTHPHAAGAGEAWLEQGYWPMLTAIRHDLRERYPDIMLNAEDAAEPYMHLLDGYLPWRFVDIGHVPAYQSIYAGRVQMTSRHYDDTTYDALFPKAAEQMLYGEQVGWFHLSRLTTEPAFKVFVKKLAHARQAFLPFFNEGDMLKPARFASPVPSVTADWGFYGPRVITTPALLHSAWRLGDGVAVLFVNTSPEPVSAGVVVDAAAWGLPRGTVRLREFGEGVPAAVSDGQVGPPRPVALAGYSLAAWLVDGGPGATTPPAVSPSAVADLFQALRRFDDEEGMTPARKQAERDRHDPWIVPESPVLQATAWIAATAAPRLLQARAAPDGTYVGWVGSSSALCFGPVDFGESTGGKAFIECDVAVPAGGSNRSIQFMDAVDGHGVPIASARLESTGGYQAFAIQRVPLPAGIAGRRNVVVTFSGSGSGLCNLRQWRLVREP